MNEVLTKYERERRKLDGLVRRRDEYQLAVHLKQLQDWAQRMLRRDSVNDVVEASGHGLQMKNE